MASELKREILGESLERMEKTTGNVKGDAINLHVKYIKYKEGEESLEKVEKKMRELGCSLDFNKINRFDWYPVFLVDLIVITSKEIFNWSNEDVFKMGMSAPRTSFVLRLFSKHISSVENLFKNASYIWERYFDSGKIEPVKIGDDFIIIRMKGYEVHPLICQQYYCGYFLSLVKMCLPGKKVGIEETKCFFREDPYHEYLIKWE